MSDDVTPDEIRAQFQWDDPTEYRWALENPSQDAAEFVGFLIGALLVFPALIWGAMYLVSWASTVVAFWIAVGLLAIVLVAWIVLFAGTWLGPRDALSRDDAEHWLPVFALGLIVYIVTGPGSLVSAGFDGPVDQILPWVTYFADQVISVVLLDIPEVYDLRISAITYESGWARLVTVLFRLLVTAGLVEFVLNFYRTRYMEHRTFATVQDFYKVCSSLPDEEGMLYTMSGRVTGVEPVRGGVEAFLKAFEVEAEADEDDDEDP